MTYTQYENYQYIQLIIGPFKDEEGNTIYPSTDMIKLDFNKDNETIIISGRLVPYRLGTYKYYLNTTNLNPGYYGFTSTATIGDVISSQIKGHFELTRPDILCYFIWKLRYKLFDWAASKYNLDFWKEGLKWNDTQLVEAINTALGDINSVGGRNLGYSLDTIPERFHGTLLTGGTLYSLMSRQIFEIEERHNYSDEVVMNIERDYTMAASMYKDMYMFQLQNVRLMRPHPRSSKSPMYFNLFISYILSLPISTHAYSYGG